MDVAGQYCLLLAGLAGDRAGPGVVLAGLGVGVPVLVVTELGDHPSAEHDAQTTLAEVDLSVRVLAKCASTWSSKVLIWMLRVARIATWARTVAAYAAATAAGWLRCSVGNAAAICRVLASRLRRRARLSAAAIWPLPSCAAAAGSGAALSSSRVSEAAKSSKATSAAGKNSPNAWHSRSRWRVRSQMSVLCARVRTLIASASALSPAIARSWWPAVRHHVGQHMRVAVTELHSPVPAPACSSAP